MATRSELRADFTALVIGEHENDEDINYIVDRIMERFDEERRALLEANRKEQFIAARFEARMKAAEQERDRWMGQFDIAEHRGMKWKDEADAAQARVKELEGAAKPALNLLLHGIPTAGNYDNARRVVANYLATALGKEE